jgi:pyruvate dehydrogenase (quinone)
MADRIGDVLLKRLAQWGVRSIYAGFGDGTLALAHADAKVELVHVAHEELAALMAAAQARLGGGIGVCLATSAQGAIQLQGGLYDAKLDRQPVLAIVAEQAELDVGELLDDVAPTSRRLAPGRLEAMLEAIDGALRAALEQRGVVGLIVAFDASELPEADMAPPDRTAAPPRVPPSTELRRAAEVLNAGRRIALLVGAGALHASDEVIALAETLGACVAKTLPGKGVVPDELPWVTGSAGPLGSGPSRELMRACDTLLLVGTRFPYPDELPSPGQARTVQIDLDPAALGPHGTIEVGLEGDAQATLAALLPRLQAKPEREFRSRIEAEVARWWQQRDARAMDDAEPINPQRVFRELSPRLPEHCIVACDAGSCARWFASDVKLRRGMTATLSGRLAAVGSALPYAIAAKYAQPGRPVLALLGDGAMQMHGLPALIAVAQLWRQWVNPRLAIMVLNDGVTAETDAPSSDLAPAFDAANEFPYAAYADLIGLRGIRVDHAEAVAPAWIAALGSDVPTLVEMVTDPRIA